MKQFGSALLYASEALKRDKDVVLTAVKNYGRALEYASPELQNDPDVVLAAVKQDGEALEFANPGLQNDSEILKAAKPGTQYPVFGSKRMLTPVAPSSSGQQVFRVYVNKDFLIFIRSSHQDSRSRNYKKSGVSRLECPDRVLESLPILMNLRRLMSG